MSKNSRQRSARSSPDGAATAAAMSDPESRAPQELEALLCPDFDQCLWALPKARALGREVYDF
jgi:hypothetical protein